jgi:hypothetical protein
MEVEVLGEGQLHVDRTPVVAIIEAAQHENAPRSRKGRRKKTRTQARIWDYATLDGPEGPVEVIEKFRGSPIPWIRPDLRTTGPATMCLLGTLPPEVQGRTVAGPPGGPLPVHDREALPDRGRGTEAPTAGRRVR